VKCDLGLPIPPPGVPRVYTMSRTRIAPSASKLSLRLGTGVLIGVDRHCVGRDNGPRWRVPAHSESLRTPSTMWPKRLQIDRT
jgi:hypothetical protein